MSLPNLGGGTLSSGSSIVTISSIENSDPDPDFHNNTDGFGNSGLRDERWYHTILQVAVPFFIAGIGTIGAGLVLAEVEVRFFSNLKETLKAIRCTEFNYLLCVSPT